MAKLFAKEGDEYIEVEAFLQSEVDEIVKPRAERIARQQFGDYDELKEKAAKVDTIKTEYEEKLNGISTEKSELAKQLAAANLSIDKVKIVHEFKLPEELHDFVTGESVEDMRAKAEKLAKSVKPGAPNLHKEEKPKETKTGTNTMAKQLFGRNSDDN